MSDLYQIIRKTRDAFILNLRDSFKHDDKYTYDDDVQISKIMIHDVTPMEPLKIPSIVIQTVSGDEMRFLDDDFMMETTTGFRRGAGLNTRTSIDILTLDTIKRDEIIDRVYQLLKSYKNILADAGVAIFKMTLEPERKTFIGDRWFYNTSISMACYSEWVLDEECTSVTSINVATVSLVSLI